MLIGNTDEIASVRGVLEETPKLKISEYDGEPTEHSFAQVRVSELRCGENWQPALGEIVVTTPSALPEQFFAGQVSAGELEVLRGIRFVDVDDSRLRFVPPCLELLQRIFRYVIGLRPPWGVIVGSHLVLVPS